jgi:alpha-1,2-glucosyltransferase
MQDEIFHVPQAQKYCSGNFFDWDSKITTFPGLYLVSAVIFNIVSKLFWQFLGHEIQCSIVFLRFLNVCISFLSFLLYRACRLKVLHRFLAANYIFEHHTLLNFVLKIFLHSQIEPYAGDSTLVAVSLFLYPVSFFYYFLFYTDTASTFSILIVYYLALSCSAKKRMETAERKNWEKKRSFFTSHFFTRQQLLLFTVSFTLFTDIL